MSVGDISTQRYKAKEWKKIYHANNNHKKAASEFINSRQNKL